MFILWCTCEDKPRWVLDRGKKWLDWQEGHDFIIYVAM